jgi:hypothetical protein
MLPSMKFQNGTQIQDGRQNAFKRTKIHDFLVAEPLDEMF